MGAWRWQWGPTPPQCAAARRPLYLAGWRRGWPVALPGSRIVLWVPLVAITRAENASGVADRSPAIETWALTLPGPTLAHTRRDRRPLRMLHGRCALINAGRTQARLSANETILAAGPTPQSFQEADGGSAAPFDARAKFLGLAAGRKAWALRAISTGLRRECMQRHPPLATISNVHAFSPPQANTAHSLGRSSPAARMNYEDISGLSLPTSSMTPAR